MMDKETLDNLQRLADRGKEGAQYVVLEPDILDSLIAEARKNIEQDEVQAWTG